MLRRLASIIPMTAEEMQQTLDEEKGADRKLTALAESRVNRKAA